MDLDDAGLAAKLTAARQAGEGFHIEDCGFTRLEINLARYQSPEIGSGPRQVQYTTYCPSSVARLLAAPPAELAALARLIEAVGAIGTGPFVDVRGAQHPTFAFGDPGQVVLLLASEGASGTIESYQLLSQGRLEQQLNGRTLRAVQLPPAEVTSLVALAVANNLADVRQEDLERRMRALSSGRILGEVGAGVTVFEIRLADYRSPWRHPQGGARTNRLALQDFPTAQRFYALLPEVAGLAKVRDRMGDLLAEPAPKNASPARAP